MLDQETDLYIPQDERALRRVQRRVDELHRRVRAWAQAVIDVLPRGLPLIPEELEVLAVYLAQQRRLNLELDAQNGEETLRSRLGRVLPFLSAGHDDWEMVQAVHRMVATRLESDLERACHSFCRDRDIPPLCDPAIDWRVSIRYLAQELHRIARQINVKTDFATSPSRFELALTARDLAVEAAARRRDLLTIFAAQSESA
ncbi:MAG TPA: hypothetical protein VFT91_05550 [Dehalococcoidia bacterium]|nr:hypothetical protein [Dehalococcoidia bacterium]